MENLLDPSVDSWFRLRRVLALHVRTRTTVGTGREKEKDIASLVGRYSTVDDYFS